MNFTSLITVLIFPPQIWFYTNDIFQNAGIPAPEIQYTTAGTGIIEIIAGLIGVKCKVERCNYTLHGVIFCRSCVQNIV